MDLLESVKMAVTTLSANKLRSSLTMLGIIIGNASVIAMIGVGQGAQRYAAGQFESLGPNVLFIVPGTDRARQRTFDIPNTLVWEDAKAIAEQVSTVQEVAPQLQGQIPVIYGNRNRNILVLGTTPSFISVRDFSMASGRFLTDSDVERNSRVTVLGCDVAKNMFSLAEDTIQDCKSPEAMRLLGERVVGQQIRIKNLSFQVVGVLEAKGAFLGNNQDDMAVIPLSTMAGRIIGRTSPYGTTLTFISLSAKNQESVDAAKFQITNLLRLRHKITNEDDFTVRTQKDALTVVGNVTNALTLMLAAIASISLFVGGIGIMNIMLVSVTERTQEIGLRKAIGASQRDILMQFIIEATILSAVGGLVGTAVGVGGILLVGSITPLQAGVSPVAILLAVSVSGGIGLFFGVVPAKRAARLDPIVALRST
jgi:putative ABC transport system permease protein